MSAGVSGGGHRGWWSGSYAPAHGWLLGWCWYLGLLDAGDRAGPRGVHFAMADSRYTYLPMLGLLIGMAAWSIPEWTRRGVCRGARPLARRLPHLLARLRWCGPGSTWVALVGQREASTSPRPGSHAGKLVGAQQPGHLHRLRKGRRAEAISQFRQRWPSRSLDPTIYHNLGMELTLEGDAAAALPEYRRAVELEPTFADGLVDLGVALLRQGQVPEARAVPGKGRGHRPGRPRGSGTGAAAVGMRRPRRTLPDSPPACGGADAPVRQARTWTWRPGLERQGRGPRGDGGIEPCRGCQAPPRPMRGSTWAWQRQRGGEGSTRHAASSALVLEVDPRDATAPVARRLDDTLRRLRSTAPRPLGGALGAGDVGLNRPHPVLHEGTGRIHECRKHRHCRARTRPTTKA